MYFIIDVVEFIDVEGASCLGNRVIKNISKDIVEYTDVVRHSSPCNRG
jgi:hypothetical protein